MNAAPKTLDEMDPPDEAACRRLLVLLNLVDKPASTSARGPRQTDVVSAPLDVRLSND